MFVEFKAEDPTRSRGPRRQRASKPKTRTGCKTCKKRRVKCDESRPECTRCLTFGVPCDGYEIDYNSGLLSKRVAPKPMGFKCLPPLTLDHFPVAALFHDETEYQYFCLFKDCLVPDNCAFLDVWNHVVIPASQTEPALRQLAICLAAGSEACRANGGQFGLINCDKAIDIINLSEEIVYYRKHSIERYGQALRGLRDLIKVRPEYESSRVALIASLMIFAYEAHNDDATLAISHMRSALKMLWKRSSKSRGYSHLKQQSPTTELEYELTAALIRIDSSLVGFAARIENLDARRQLILDYPYLGEKCTVPKTFTTVEEARRYFEHVETRSVRSIPQEFMDEMMQIPQTDDGSSGTLLPCALIYDRKDEELRNWNEAFKPLFENCFDGSRTEDFFPAAYLKIQALALDMTTQEIHLPESPSKDRRLEAIAHEILDLGRWIVEDIHFSKHFSFDLGILPSLSAIVFTIRDIGIRREAVEVLRATIPRREGIWDSVKIVEVCENILDMEEEGTRKSVTYGLSVTPLHSQV